MVHLFARGCDRALWRLSQQALTLTLTQTLTLTLTRAHAAMATN